MLLLQACAVIVLLSMANIFSGSFFDIYLKYLSRYLNDAYGLCGAAFLLMLRYPKQRLNTVFVQASAAVYNTTTVYLIQVDL